MTEKANAPLALTRVLATGAKVLHELLLDPDIGPMALLGHTKTDGIDLVPFLADERNIALLAYDSEVRGAILFAWMEPGVYEVHTMCKRDARGAKYVRAVRDAIRIMFTMSDAIELYTRVPRENNAALGLVRLVYGKKQFVRADGTPMYALRFWDWLWSPLGLPLAERGKWFHNRLEEQFVAQGRGHEQHEDSEDHNRVVGVVSEMILACLIEKGLILYNRWAKLAGYEGCSVVVPVPLVLNIGDALIQIDFEHRDFLLLDARPEDLGRGEHSDWLTRPNANERAV